MREVLEEGAESDTVIGPALPELVMVHVSVTGVDTCHFRPLPVVSDYLHDGELDDHAFAPQPVVHVKLVTSWRQHDSDVDVLPFLRIR